MSTDFENSSLHLRRSALQNGLAGASSTEGEIIPRIKTFLSEAREIQLQAQRSGMDGGLVSNIRSDAIDIILEALYVRVGKDAEAITLVATGGYGRGELCPLSDVDLLVLVPSHSATTKAAVEKILYPLWDVGLKVGQSVRTVSEATSYAQDDLHLQVALLETRYLCGATEPYNQLTSKLSKALSGDKWTTLAQAIVDAQRKRREKAGGSAYLQEPDLKNGVGALRDVQSCIWLARLKSGSTTTVALSTSGLLPNGDFKKFQEARSTLLRIRCELHFQVTRPTEQLSLERQNLVAQGLGFSGDIKERIGMLMRMYFDAADHVRRCVELVEGIVLNEPEPKGYGKPIVVDGFSIIPGGVASAQHRLVFDEDPGRLVRLFRLCQMHDAQPERALSILVRERAQLLDDAQAFSESSTNALRAMLTEGGRVYKAINALREHGLLYRLVPEFAGLHCLVQFEFYHRWTADVHTLRCLWELDEIYSGKTEIDRAYREILFGLESPSLVYAILFLHDIAKSGGIAGHAERGVPIAEHILERLGFDAREREISRVVILNHLVMGLYSQRHDIDEPRNIERFANLLGDEQILRALYVHTRCDARGTSPDLWTEFKDRQHWTLYRRTSDKIAGTAENQSQENVRILRTATDSMLGHSIPVDEVEAHFTQMPGSYFRHVIAEDAATHVKLIHRLISAVTSEDYEILLKPIVEWVDEPGSSQSLVTVVTWDRAGLFSRMAGAFAVAGINIISCRAFSRNDDVALDFFKVVLPAGKEQQSKDKFNAALASSLIESADLLDAVGAAEQYEQETAPYRKSTVPVDVQVDVYFEKALNRTVVEVQCNDRIGLLFRIGRVIQEAGYTITFANIATEQGFALDTFYLIPEKGRNMPSHPPEAILEALRAVLS